MNRFNMCLSFCRLLVTGVAGWSLAGSVLLGQGHPSLQEGATVSLGGRTATIKRIDALPHVESEFTGRFRFDSFANPKFKELRKCCQLDAVVAPGQDEFERQVLLLDWVHHRFKKFGRPSSEAKGALEILRAVDEGHTFFCSRYAHVFVSAAASLGWIDRELALRRSLHQGANRLEVRTVNQFGVAGPISAVEGLLATGEASAGPDKYPFFPFCIDWHDAKKRSFEQQAQMLKELGYPGVGHIWLDKVEERIQTLDAAGLKLFQITMAVEVAPGKTPYDANRFKDVCAAIQGRGVQFCLLLNGMKPSDPAVDPHAVDILRAMSDQAKASGAQLLLYPHQASWVERIEDAIRVADKVDRPNVGVMFNLCHWLRVDPGRDYRPLLKRALPRLWAVSINGADEFDEKPGWERYIQPLDKGSFDVGRLLRTLKELGYQGPIGLQCYGIGGDAREHLARSMTAWQKLSENLKN